VVAVLVELVNTAWYWLPVCAAVTLLSVSVVEVAPLMLAKLAAPAALTCHCTVGVGVPLAAAVNVTVLPAVVALFVGWVVTTGATEEMGVAVASAALRALPCCVHCGDLVEIGWPLTSPVLVKEVPLTGVRRDGGRAFAVRGRTAIELYPWRRWRRSTIG